MPDLTAKRTLVKSPPELWEELSEVDRLAKHLGAFGEITITKLEPEHTVAWEGECASGTVSIEPSGWGTKVTLRAELPEPDEAEAEPAPEPEPEPVAATAPEQSAAKPGNEAQHVAGPFVPFRVEPDPGPEADAEIPEETPRRGFWGWLLRRRTEPVTAGPKPVAADSEPDPVAAAEPEPEPPAVEPAPLDGQPEALGAAPALDPERARVILDEALDTLGAAHHRPFSRG